MSGFRCYNNTWTDGTTYYNETHVKPCLEKLCEGFLSDTSYHGWSLDTEIHTSGATAILLPPSVSVYAMFFVHTSGARLMIALNYRGLSNATDIGTRSVNTLDIGFYNQPDWFSANISSSYAPCPVLGGLIGMYIPPAQPGETQPKFDISKNMNTSDFAPSTATYPCCTCPTMTFQYSNYHKRYNYSQSLVKMGTTKTTNDTYSSISTDGAYASDVKSYTVMADNSQNIILCSLCADPGKARPAIRWCALGKLRPDEYDNPIGYSFCQCYRNFNVSSVGICDRVSSYAQYTTDYSPGTQVLGYYAYCYPDNSELFPQLVWPNGNRGRQFTVPYLVGNYRYNNIDGEYFYTLNPIMITGGVQKPYAWLDYDSIRSVTYRSDIPPGSYFENKKWLMLGYYWSCFGASFISTLYPSIQYVEGNSQRDLFVVKLDEGNTGSPFGPWA